MSSPVTSYPATKSAGVCAITGVPFTPGQEVVAALIRESDASLRRIDATRDAWEQGPWAKGQPQEAALVGLWRTHYAARAGNDSYASTLRDEDLLAIFEDGSSHIAADARQQRFRYLITLLLVRKRILRVLGSPIIDGLRVLRVQQRGGTASGITAPVIDVVDPGLDESAIAELLEQFGTIAQGV